MQGSGVARRGGMGVLCLLMLVVATACGGAARGVRFDDGSSGFVTTCGGERGEWAQCHAAAASSCASGYLVVEEEGFELQGLIKRNLYFKCKR